MRFDPKRRKYVDERGRVLSARQIKKEIEDYVALEEERVEREAAKFAAGAITVAGFFLYMENKIEAWHKVAGAVAYGGRIRMDARRDARIERIIKSEQSYLAAFRSEVATLSAEGIVNRAGMYPNAAYATYENQLIQRESDNGVTLGRRIIEDDGQSCEGCIASATEEFIPLDDIPEIGSQECISRCRCEIEFQIGDTEFRPSEIFTGVIGGQDQYGGGVEIN